MAVEVAEIGPVVVVMFCGGSSQTLALMGELYVVVIKGMDCDASSNSSAATWELHDSVIGDPPTPQQEQQ